MALTETLDLKLGGNKLPQQCKRAMMNRLDSIGACRTPWDHHRVLVPTLLWTIFVIGSTEGIASDQPVELARQSFLNDWDSKFTRIETARADFQQLFLMRVELNPYSRTELLGLLERHRDLSDANNRQEIAKALCSDRIPKDLRVWFSMHALKRQMDVFLAGRTSYRARLNSHDVYRSYEQVVVYDDGALNLHVYTTEELRQEMTKGFVENSQWEHISDSRFKLSYRSEKYNSSIDAEIDDTTGFIHSWRNSDFGGNILDETLQYEPIVLGDGIVFPRMRVHCEYDHGNVTLACSPKPDPCVMRVYPC